MEKTILILHPTSSTTTIGLSTQDSAFVTHHTLIDWNPSINNPALQEEREEGQKEALSALGLRHIEPVFVGFDELDQRSEGVDEIEYPLVIDGLAADLHVTHVKAQLSKAWTKAVSQSLDIDSEQFSEYSVVLVAADNFGIGELEVMVDVVLDDMGFREVIVHSDSTAAVFGQAISGGCVVNVDDQFIRISCVEDGVLLPKSHLILPFGGNHICQAMQISLGPYVPSCTSSEIRRARDEVCFFPGEGPIQSTEAQIESRPEVILDGRRIRVGSTACTAPLGIFYPKMLLPHSTCSSISRTCYSEEFYTQVLSDPESVKFPPRHQTQITSSPLDAAIVQSISSVEDVELRRRLYTNILIVGPCSHITGFADMVERRVLSALPADEVIDTVAILEPKLDPLQTIFKGGVSLGSLSDQWVTREEWLNKKEKPSKLGKRDLARCKVYWLFKTETSMS